MPRGSATSFQLGLRPPAGFPFFPTPTLGQPLAVIVYTRRHDLTKWTLEAEIVESRDEGYITDYAHLSVTPDLS